MITEPTLTLAETAAILNVSAKTVRQRIKRGDLPGHLVEGLHGPEYRVPAAAVETVQLMDGFQGGAGNGTRNGSQSGVGYRGGEGTLEADSSRLNSQAQRAGQATVNGTLEAGGISESRDAQHRAELALERAELLQEERDRLALELQRIHTRLAVKEEELRRRDLAEEKERERHQAAESDLHKLLLFAQQHARELAQQLEQKALPPVHPQSGYPRQVRWWKPSTWGR